MAPINERTMKKEDINCISLYHFTMQMFEDKEKNDTLYRQTKKEHEATLVALMDKRLDGLNHALTRTEFTIAHDKIIEDIRSLRESRAELMGKASVTSVIISIVFAILSLFVSLLGILLNFSK